MPQVSQAKGLITKGLITKGIITKSHIHVLNPVLSTRAILHIIICNIFHLRSSRPFITTT